MNYCKVTGEMKHACTCPKCNKGKKKDGDTFTQRLPDGTFIYGPKGFDRPDRSNYHGHQGENFDRSPHSTIGSAAIDDPHTYEEHKKKRTKRW